MADVAENAKGAPTDEKEKALQKSPADVVTRWVRELAAADSHEKNWRLQAEKIVGLYKDQKAGAEASDEAKSYRFNILFSNTEVLKGALYSQCPAPDVRRRYMDKDPVGRVAALVLARALIASLDKQTDGEDFDSVMKDSVFDMVVPGRAAARVKYVPQYGKTRVPFEMPQPVPAAEGMEPPPAPEIPPNLQQDEQGYFTEVEEVVYECVEPEYVEWAFFRMSPAKRWKKVRWVAWGELLTRDDLVAQFGEKIGNEVALKWMPKGMEDSAENAIFKRALAWTIWNKTDRTVYVISEGYTDAPLATQPDPLRLEQFFPIPRPLYSIFTTDSLIPVPEYTLYQDDSIQLDTLNERIAVLSDALRRRGVYDAATAELSDLATAGDNKFVPVKNYREFVEKGGLQELFQELDLTGLVGVLRELQLQAEAKKANIYEKVGISDIMRGSTQAQETLGAQKIKNQWGSIRVQPRQAEVQRYARDLIRIMAEIIAEHFSEQTLALMTGIQLAFTEAERMQLAQTDPQNPMGRRPSWEAVMKVLRSDKLRGFKVDIETDSTVKARADEEQKNRVDLITAVTGFLEKALPAVQSGMIPKKVAGELMMFGVRAFPASPQLEEVLDEWISGGAMGDGEGEGEGQQGEDASKKAMEAEQQAVMQHNAEMRDIEKQAATANMVAAKAKAYQEITKGEAMAPGVQLDLLSKQAKLAGILDPAAQPGAEAPMQPPVGGAPVGAMVQ